MMGSRQRYFLYRKPCDLRRSFYRLAGMVREDLNEDPMCGDVFIFINRRKNMLKCLYWDEDGYAIWQKRLEKGCFSLPQGVNAQIDQLSLMHILAGIRVQIIGRQPRYKVKLNA